MTVEKLYEVQFSAVTKRTRQAEANGERFRVWVVVACANPDEVARRAEDKLDNWINRHPRTAHYFTPADFTLDITRLAGSCVAVTV